jgi:histidinol-phosphatase (PHP family)
MLDCHMHTPRCKHATGCVREYAERACAQGLLEIAVTDHAPMPQSFHDHTWRMDHFELSGYVGEVLDARRAFAGRLDIRLGLECDFVPGTEEFVREILASAPFDFAIGSVHYLGSWNFDHERHAAEFGRRDLERTWREYFQTVADMARSGIFHVAGHLDLIKKWGHRPPSIPWDTIEAALDAIAAAGMAIEVNTSGLRRPCREMYPARAILERACARAIPLTLSSDAHRPDEVGAGFDAARALLRDLGVRTLASFREGRLIPVPISS